jgi:hypothetical protein
MRAAGRPPARVLRDRRPVGRVDPLPALHSGLQLDEQALRHRLRVVAAAVLLAAVDLVLDLPALPLALAAGSFQRSRTCPTSAPHAGQVDAQVRGVPSHVAATRTLAPDGPAVGHSVHSATRVPGGAGA